MMFIFKAMKKILFASILCCSLFAIIACRKEAEVRTCDIHIDELTDSTLRSKIGDDMVTFVISAARYTNGAIMVGDSATISYTGDIRTKHVAATIVKLIPPKGNFVDGKFDPTKELKKAPMSDEEAKDFDKFVESENARQAAKGKK